MTESVGGGAEAAIELAIERKRVHCIGASKCGAGEQSPTGVGPVVAGEADCAKIRN